MSADRFRFRPPPKGLRTLPFRLTFRGAARAALPAAAHKGLTTRRRETCARGVPEERVALLYFFGGNGVKFDFLSSQVNTVLLSASATYSSTTRFAQTSTPDIPAEPFETGSLDVGDVRLSGDLVIDRDGAYSWTGSISQGWYTDTWIREESRILGVARLDAAGAPTMQITFGGHRPWSDVAGRSIRDLLDGEARVMGSAGADDFRLTDATDIAYGDAGDDRIHGRGGYDLLHGGAGDDRLDGGSGGDLLDGGDGDDALIVDDARDLALGGEGFDTLRSTVSVKASMYSDVERIDLVGCDAIDATGKAGDQILDGNAGRNRLDGAAGHDLLFGRGGQDRLLGGHGRDLLDGGGGRDVLIGGTGRDVFHFGSAKDLSARVAWTDVVRDFHKGDRLDFSDFDAGLRHFVGDEGFSKKAGEYGYYHERNHTIVHGDIDGDGRADWTLDLVGRIALAETDFLT